MFDSVKDGSERETETAVDCCVAASLTVAKLSTRSAGCGGCKEAAALEWVAVGNDCCCAAVKALDMGSLRLDCGCKAVVVGLYTGGAAVVASFPRPRPRPAATVDTLSGPRPRPRPRPRPLESAFGC